MQHQLEKRPAYYFTTRELVIIALISALGGVLSTYVGYLGNLVNKLFGVPFGAGQFMAGLHVFWFILVRGLIRKNGAGTAAGLLKGVVEMLAGSVHGVVIVIVSLVQGLAVDVVMALLRRGNTCTFAVAGGLSSATNVFVFQVFYLGQVPLEYILLIALLALVSGIVFGGYFGAGVVDLVTRQGIINVATENDKTRSGADPPAVRLRVAASIVFALALAGGAVYYYVAVHQPFWSGPVCRVEGKVDQPYDYRWTDFANLEVTVNAELKGQVTYQPARDYTGVPLKDILARAKPREEDAAQVKVIASDGYEVVFDLNDVMGDDALILVPEDESYRVVGANYEGGYWVRKVSRLVVE